LDKKILERTITKLFSEAHKRNFDESVELIVTFKNLNIKNKEHRFEFVVTIPNPFITKVKSLVFVKDKNLAVNLKGIVDKVVLDEEISKLSKKDGKKLANEYDVFLAEGSAMLTVGKYLGQTLSPRGKMPLIAPPNPETIKAIISSSPSKIKVSNKKNKSSVAIQTRIGKRSQEPSKIVDNTLALYNSLIDKLPAGKQNIKDISFKTTMSKPLKVGGGK